MQYRLLDHTADIGLQVWGRDLKSLFENAAAALADLVTDITRVQASQDLKIELASDDVSNLFIDWMRELLYLINAELKRIRWVDIRSLSETHVCAVVHCQAYDPRQHPIHHDIKAATYHQLNVVKTPAGWEATVILDV